jgi:hypothetical protein
MSVRAKFKVDRIERIQMSVPKVNGEGKTEYVPGEVRTITLSPVYGNGDPKHENTKFWQASPSGIIQLGCANLAVAETFELGKEYYVDFTPAEASS